MNQSDLKILDNNGWVEIHGLHLDNELLSLANSLGTVIGHPNGCQVFTLKPKNGLSSTKGTFSHKNGFNKFPLHTDTAFFVNPIRYMLLSSNKPSATTTTLLHIKSLFEKLNEHEKKIASNAIFKVKTNETSFYTALLFKEHESKAIKYDPTCMFPANNSAKQIQTKFTELFKQIEVKHISWNEPKTVVIDNWKILHGRSEVNPDENRELKRIYIK
jgi:alpha-ketoglutarate-dependent taurine dioxygenase